MLNSRGHATVVAFIAGLLLGFSLAFTFSVRTCQKPGPTVFRPPSEHETRTAVPLPRPNSPLKKNVFQAVPFFAERLASASYTEVEDAYYKRLGDVHVKCDRAPHVGRAGNGGWDVCMAPGFKLHKPCLVYSFGVNDVWGFDESLARDYGCVVRAFDPSMSANSHVHEPGPVNFYKLGLDGANTTLSNGWKMLTFESLLRKFGEAGRTLDLVKMDIEYSEWASFESMLRTGMLERIKQLVFEVHTSDMNGDVPTKEAFLRYHKVFDSIEALGFRRFFRHDNPYGVGAVVAARAKTNHPIYKKSVKLLRTCCHEVHYINLNLVKNTAGLTAV